MCSTIQLKVLLPITPIQLWHPWSLPLKRVHSLSCIKELNLQSDDTVLYMSDPLNAVLKKIASYFRGQKSEFKSFNMDKQAGDVIGSCIKSNSQKQRGEHRSLICTNIFEKLSASNYYLICLQWKIRHLFLIGTSFELCKIAIIIPFPVCKDKSNDQNEQTLKFRTSHVTKYNIFHPNWLMQKPSHLVVKHRWFTSRTWGN